jgi:hypothetical protein
MGYGIYWDASIDMLTSMSLSLNSAGIGTVRVITLEVGTATAARRKRVPDLRQARLIASPHRIRIGGIAVLHHAFAQRLDGESLDPEPLPGTAQFDQLDRRGTDIDAQNGFFTLEQSQVTLPQLNQIGRIKPIP